jgi:hypothetical protein
MSVAAGGTPVPWSRCTRAANPAAVCSPVTGAVGGPSGASHERVHAAMSRLVELGQREGRFRGDIASGDLVMAMTGFCLVTDAPGRQDHADRLVALLVEGLKHGANR